jgi:hypothetical protein
MLASHASGCGAAMKMLKTATLTQRELPCEPRCDCGQERLTSSCARLTVRSVSEGLISVSEGVIQVDCQSPISIELFDDIITI